MPLNTITVHLVSPRAAATAAAELKERLTAVRVEQRRIELLPGANTDRLPALLREEADIIETIKELEGERP